MPLWKLSHLSLSYKNIIEIDNLGGMEKLVRLQLDNNIICQIQHLDHLVNLEWLDLSFNLIEKIEGLDKLTKLSDLSLYSNQIKELSGLEELKELNVLSVGKNLIPNYEHAIQYLVSLKNKLEVLKMAENPGSMKNEFDYKQYSIAYLKDLKYLDYELIEDEIREKANEKYKEEIQEKETQKASDLKEEHTHQHNPDLDDAKISSTEDMLETIMKADEESVKLMALNKFQEIF